MPREGLKERWPAEGAKKEKRTRENRSVYDPKGPESWCCAKNVTSCFQHFLWETDFLTATGALTARGHSTGKNQNW